MSEEGEIPQISEPSESLEKKERVKKPTRPEDDAYKQKVEALQDTINQCKAKLEKIKQTLDDRRGGRTKGSSEQQLVKNKLAELRNQFQSILKNKIQMRAQMDAAIKTRESVKQSLRDLRSTMKFTTVEEIDEHIEQLESRMQHSTLSLVEEKRILEDIRKLKASRNTVGEYSERLEALSVDDSTRSELQAGIKALDDQLNAIKVKEEELREELGAMREKDQEVNGDVPTLLQEREELKEVSKQAYDKIKELRAEQDAKWTEFKAQEKLWRAQNNEDRKLRQERYEAERAAKAAERAARAAENAPEPFDKEVTMCEQLVNYLSKYVEDTSAVGAEEEKKEIVALDGMKALAKSSKVDDEDAWLLGKSKGGKGGKGKGKKGAGGGEGEARKQQEVKLSHTFDILEAFTALKVTVPATASAVPPVLEDVKSKKEVYLKKREEVKEKAASEPTPSEAAAATDNTSEAPTSSEDQPANGDSSTTTNNNKNDKNEKTATASTPKEKKSGGGKSKAAPDTPALKLDDSASWPAVGAEATTAIATTATTAAVDNDDDDNKEEEVEAEEQVATPEAPSAAAAEAPEEEDKEEDVAIVDAPPAKTEEVAASGQRVTFTVNGDTVSISINHDD